jgi:hypothetical protein
VLGGGENRVKQLAQIQFVEVVEVGYLGFLFLGAGGDRNRQRQQDGQED